MIKHPTECVTREGLHGSYIWKAVVTREKSNRNIFGRHVAELFVRTRGKHKFLFLNRKVRLNTLDMDVLIAIVKEAEEFLAWE